MKLFVAVKSIEMGARAQWHCAVCSTGGASAEQPGQSIDSCAPVFESAEAHVIKTGHPVHVTYAVDVRQEPRTQAQLDAEGAPPAPVDFREARKRNRQRLWTMLALAFAAGAVVQYFMIRFVY